MSYQVYHDNALGYSLVDTLDKLLSEKKIPDTLALKILKQFERSLVEGLTDKAQRNVCMKAVLKNYRFCDNVWTMMLADVEMREGDDVLKLDELKLIARDENCEQNGRMNWAKRRVKFPKKRNRGMR